MSEGKSGAARERGIELFSLPRFFFPLSLSCRESPDGLDPHLVSTIRTFLLDLLDQVGDVDRLARRDVSHWRETREKKVFELSDDGED